MRTDFAASLARTLWCQVCVFGASFVLMLALPAGAGRRRPDEVAGLVAADADDASVAPASSGVD